MTTIAASWVAENPKKGNLDDLIQAYGKFSESDGAETMQAILEAIAALNLPESHSFLKQAYAQANNAALVNQLSDILSEMDIEKTPRPEIKASLFLPDTLVTEDDKIDVIIQTSRGEIIIELLPGAAPATVSNFIYLVKKKFYNNIVCCSRLRSSGIWLGRARV